MIKRAMSPKKCGGPWPSPGRPRGQRVIARLSRAEEERLIGQAYRMPGVRGLLIKTLFQTGARVSEFVHLQVPDVYFDEQMLLITHAKGGKQRYVPLLPDLTHELRTYLRDRTTGPLFDNDTPHALFPAAYPATRAGNGGAGGHHQARPSAFAAPLRGDHAA